MSPRSKPKHHNHNHNHNLNGNGNMNISTPEKKMNLSNDNLSGCDSEGREDPSIDDQGLNYKIPESVRVTVPNQFNPVRRDSFRGVSISNRDIKAKRKSKIDSKD